MHKRKKKLIKPSLYLTSYIFIFMLISFNGFSETLDEVYIAAYEGLNLFINSIPVGFEKQYGFENREEFDIATLGEPYQMHTIHPKNLIYEISLDNNYIVPLAEWRFPVICNGKIRVLLTVSKMNGKWRAVGIGGAGIAAELDKVETIFLFNGKNVKKVLLRLYQIKADFVAICEYSERIEEGMFYPLQSAYMAIGGGEQRQAIFSFKELLPLLKKKHRSVLFKLKKNNQLSKRRK